MFGEFVFESMSHSKICIMHVHKLNFRFLELCLVFFFIFVLSVFKMNVIVVFSRENVFFILVLSVFKMNVMSCFLERERE